ncbi:unnamed protein product, partial [Heterosigma akashiwo]
RASWPPPRSCGSAASSGSCPSVLPPGHAHLGLPLAGHAQLRLPQVRPPPRVRPPRNRGHRGLRRRDRRAGLRRRLRDHPPQAERAALHGRHRSGGGGHRRHQHRGGQLRRGHGGAPAHRGEHRLARHHPGDLPAAAGAPP